MSTFNNNTTTDENDGNTPTKDRFTSVVAHLRTATSHPLNDARQKTVRFERTERNDARNKADGYTTIRNQPLQKMPIIGGNTTPKQLTRRRAILQLNRKTDRHVLTTAWLKGLKPFNSVELRTSRQRRSSTEHTNKRKTQVVTLPPSATTFATTRHIYICSYLFLYFFSFMFS